jgi:uncharacterized repeat protein (TIGR03803 family)
MSKLLPLCIVLLTASISVSAQTYTVLHNFGSKAGDPTGPRYSGVISQSRGGNMFSSADDHWTDQRGAAFSVTPSGAVTVVHRFALPGAIRPVGGLTLARDGQYYGANKTGGTYNYGNIFKMKQGGGLTVLHTFDPSDNASGCSHPYAPPIQSVRDDFYGTAIGEGSGNGCVYRISADTGQFTVLHTFNGTDGRGPYAPLVQGADFNFYGTTRNGGWSGYGTFFRISSTGDFESLWTFDGFTGAFPMAGLIEGSDGNFYGTTSNGAGLGVVFKTTPGGTVTVLHDFGAGGEGKTLIGGLVQATDGNFYGTASEGGANGAGVLYRVSPAGDFAVLHNFDVNTGGNPQNTLMQHTNGILYGTTEAGGNAGKGTFFNLDLGLPPLVTYLPTYGRVGALVQILGQGFTGGSEVFFNGTPATYKLVYPTYIRATVPDAATTGPITVTTTNGTLTSNKVFIVHP